MLDVVHDKVLRPILLAGRALAFGLIIVFAGHRSRRSRSSSVSFDCSTSTAFSGHEYLSYVSVGAISLLAGLIIWRKRRPLKLRK